MKFYSTRNKDIKTSFTEAIETGLAPDGGLYIPENFPQVKIDNDKNYHDFAKQFLKPFVENTLIEAELEKIVKDAFNFDIGLKNLNSDTAILELFHGPTLSFKDVGARFLANCMGAIAKNKAKTILVATSGDTGSAVASAFSDQKNIRAVILFPEGKISKRQQQQITCWGKNILAIAIKGTFDDCQHLVKTAFADDDWAKFNLTTSNSINIGRLLPQAIYYAYTATEIYKNTGQAMRVIVPSGNLGNVTAAFWAKAMGFPIEKIVIACNENKAVYDFYETGQFQPRSSVETLANAMDVGNPSNFERLQDFFKNHENFRDATEVFTVTDEQIEETIKRYYEKHNELLCPHTATAAFVREKFGKEPWVIVATAHPAKFENVIEPLINKTIDIPTQLKAMLTQENHFEISGAELSLVKQLIEKME